MPRHFVALDSLRGIAALMVAFHHFRTDSLLDGLTIVRQAWLFVDFFFLLSGFVIAATYRDRLARGHGVLPFMLLRIGRLYPLHLAILAAFVAAEGALLIAGPGFGAEDARPSPARPISGRCRPTCCCSRVSDSTRA